MGEQILPKLLHYKNEGETELLDGGIIIFSSNESATKIVESRLLSFYIFLSKEGFKRSWQHRNVDDQ